jgi:MOSC domain-containing protein YiiM
MTDRPAPQGRVEALWLKTRHRGPMQPVAEAQLIAGQGLVGSVGRSKRRQVTLIEQERWQGFMAELDASIEPSARRANIMLSGIRLTDTRKQRLRIGDVVVEIGGHTTPCERMEEALQGLQAAMAPEWGGGAFAQVLNDGVVRVGDGVGWEDEQGPAPSAQGPACSPESCQ